MTPGVLAGACADAMLAADHSSQGLGMIIREVEPGWAVLDMEMAGHIAHSGAEILSRGDGRCPVMSGPDGIGVAPRVDAWKRG